MARAAAAAVLLLASTDALAPPRRPAVSRADLLRLLPAAAVIAVPRAARAADQKSINVPFGTSGTGAALAEATFSVPDAWVKLSGDPGGGRRLELYADPANSDTNAFALITPVRGDYTGLGSFGSVEVVQATVMPPADDISYEVIRTEAPGGRYVYEYTVSVPDQPKRHLTTVFMVQQDCIVTFNAQAKQSDYSPAVAKVLQESVKSFKTANLKL
mmetsp:Transcript_18540/g.55129  ORF Transcript_18540/g.55129 Transcript_18540/m.55129 type:complete len:215 (-) Transcript_18540:18-662(-)